MKDRLKGKMVKTKREKVQAFDVIDLECLSCYWEGTNKDCKKLDNNICVCPQCNNVLDSYEDWDYKL